MSLFEARRERDVGLAKTRSKNSAWTAQALAMLPYMKAEGFDTCTGEGMRNWLLANGLDAPSSPHAWGALTVAAVKRGVLQDTGRVVQMTDVRSHARRTPLWKFL